MAVRLDSRGVALPAGVPTKCRWLFQKRLTASDTNKLGRMILPRQARLHFWPHRLAAALEATTCREVAACPFTS